MVWPKLPRWPGGGADGDDPPGDAVFLEVAERFADAGEGALQVDVDHRVEVLVGHLQQGLVPQDPGVGDEDVQPAERLHSFVHQLLGNVRAPDGGDDGNGTAAVGFDGAYSVCYDVRVHIVDDDGGALACEFPGVGESKAASAPGDDCCFA